MTKPGETIPKLENLEYPFVQAFYCLKKMELGRKLEQGTKNAYLESFLLNARNIVDLLRGKNTKKDVTYATFLNKTGIKQYKKEVNASFLKKISEKISNYASHLKPEAKKQTWNDIRDAFPLFVKYRDLLIELSKKYPKDE